jgi:endoglucanase
MSKFPAVAPDATPPEAAPAVEPPPTWPALSEADRGEWAAFKAHLISGDGRIIDTGNHGVSHSEGQGVGMLFAVMFDDPATFEAIFGWTQRHLLREDGLHAWRYIPGAPNPVSDPNNATDGDIYIAAALHRAARRWGRADYLAAARRTAQTIHDTLLEQVGGRLVLLPAQYGFSHRDHVVVNLSYYIFPLFGDLAALVPSSRWAKLGEDGVALVTAARFGHWRLPPDWLDVRRADSSIAPSDSFPQRFSWDAVRVPLFLAWGGVAPDVVRAAATFWQSAPLHPPAWVDLRTGAVADYAAPPGVQAIANIARSQGSRSREITSIALTVTNDTYYSAALTLLARLAARQIASSRQTTA